MHMTKQELHQGEKLWSQNGAMSWLSVLRSGVMGETTTTSLTTSGSADFNVYKTLL